MEYTVIASRAINVCCLVQADEEAKKFFGVDDPKTKLFDSALPTGEYFNRIKDVFMHSILLTRIYNGEYDVLSCAIPYNYRSVNEFPSFEDASAWTEEDEYHRLIVGVCPISNVILWESARERNFKYVVSRNAFRDIKVHRVWRPFANCISSIFTCEGCGRLYNTYARIKADGRHVCEDCARRMGYKKCVSCREYHQNCSDIDGSPVCSECLSLVTFKCDVCKELHLIRNKLEYAGKKYCKKCFDKYVHSCTRCGTHNDLIDVGWGKYMCSACYEKVGNPEYNGTEQMSYHEFNSDSYLAMEKRMPDEAPSTRYFGVELETEGIEFDALDISSFLEDTKIHMEEDGSLGNDGIEFISAPCTLRYHKEKFDWEMFCCRIREADGRSHDTNTCGLHVHVTRKSIPSSAIVKMNVVLNKYLPSLSKTIARRNSIYCGSYDPCKRVKVTDGFYDDIPKYIFDRIGHCPSARHNDRYNPINLTNRNTVEFRIFRGTTNYETILASIEYCDALIEYSDSVSVKDIHNKELWHTRHFLEFVKKNEKYKDIIPTLIRLANEYCPKSEVRELIQSYKGITADNTYEQ